MDDDPLAVAGEVIGIEGSQQGAQRDYAGAYGEVLLPLGEDWEADVAVRYDRYEAAGSATSPKIALAWRPSPAWLLRASWGRGFQAPDLASAYASPILSGDFFLDERACAIRPGDPIACEPFAWDTVLVSNPGLAPERRRARPASTWPRAVMVIVRGPGVAAVSPPRSETLNSP